MIAIKQYMVHTTIFKHIFGLYAKIRNNNTDLIAILGGFCCIVRTSAKISITYGWVYVKLNFLKRGLQKSLLSTHHHQNMGFEKNSCQFPSALVRSGGLWCDKCISLGQE